MMWKLIIITLMVIVLWSQYKFSRQWLGQVKESKVMIKTNLEKVSIVSDSISY